ncbi:FUSOBACTERIUM OUTER MEMBRANE PROTEIN FAMILY [Fusobacterium vincentii ATCC 49256]|uniref:FUSOBACTERIUM OUTER MEMBRANE PROTEIN FAMILY n=1 Tax=Fusobacterium vincentii ATCC 49256 TaxID=209882 RepID=Q7P2K2_FUSVC|nr:FUSOBACTERIUM OUTER MEMBRANE PROTEIN FAMILY [Fusobacterium vincentii ATCC 49256]
MYVDTLRGTNPINGLNKLNVKKAELLYGVEAAQNSNSKYFEVSGKILKPYQDAVRNASGIKWSHNSAAFTWMALPTVDSNGVPLKVGMAKIPYTEFAGKEPMPVEVSDTYNFLDGLEQRYDKNALDSREKLLFNKLNGIGNNESVLFYQATDEMMGHQYANVQQRINATGNILNKEFDYLRSEWQTVSKDSNKVKVFGTRGEYKTDTAGVIDYKNYAYGVAYVHENEDIKLGRGIGWYAGMVHNTFRFKDIGNSKERQLQGKVGLFKSVPFDDNNSLNWTISGDIFIGHNKMHRKFLVVDDIFNAKARYYTYGIGIKNELGKEFRLSESFTLRPYVALGLEYGRVSKIREKSGEIKLEVKQNHYISVKPEVGAELAFKHYFGRKTFKVGLGVAYENELGRVAKGKNKARVADTNADWFNIRSEKDDRKGNVKFDLNLGLDNQRYGVTANVGYDTKGENIRGGLGLRVIF